MSAGSGFVPAATVECPYQPQMTRAAALALRAANGLLANCVVVITDGPTIGVAGNTSPTTIELNPVSANNLGFAARVQTTFDNESWVGTYDIDLGTAGSITRLMDGFQNIVIDQDADSPTVQTQWPWHLGDAANMSNNTIEDCSFVNLTPGVAQGAFSRNFARGSTFDFSNKVGGQVTNNEFRNALVQCTGGGLLSIQRSRFIQPNGTQCVAHTGTGSLTMFNCDLREQAQVVYSSSATSSWVDAFLVNSTTIVTVAGSHALTVNNSYLRSTPVNLAGATGSTQILASRLIDSSIGRPSTATGGSHSINRSEVINSTFVAVAGATTATYSFTNSRINSVVAAIQAAQALTVLDSYLDASTFTMGAGATRGLTFNRCDVRAFNIAQNRTVSAGADTFADSTLIGRTATTMLTLAGAAAPAGALTVAQSSTLIDGAVATLTDTSASPVLNGTEIRGAGTTLTVPAGAGSATSCRFAAGATVNLATFAHTNTIVDGLFPTTFTAANANRLRDKAFSDVV